jgi:PPK2 family polyphosphate:nucleotide phosphotransferase
MAKQGGSRLIREEYMKRLLVTPGSKVVLKDYSTDWKPDGDKKEGKKAAREQATALLDANRAALAESQELLWASNLYSVLIILQGMDTSGKDGTIKHVMSGANPQGCRVTSFKVPTSEETDHNFLWRFYRALPARGEIGIFNRSYYEDVLVVKVHPEILDRQQLPPGKRDDTFWNARYEDINAFERHLVQNGTFILKFFLHISKEEQRKRLMDRLEEKEKYWKFSLSDLAERKFWDQYQDAYEKMLAKTSTEIAPWYIIPADTKWTARCLISDIISTKIRSLDLDYPAMPEETLQKLDEARRQLASG